MEAHGGDVLGAVLEGRYRVDAPLARGGMSSVYSGLDLRLDRPVAIKVMESTFAQDRSFIQRFELEARAAARLHHPGVVAVHDQGVDGDHVYLVMELVSGGTLRDLLRERGVLPVPLAISVMEPMLSALASAHRAGLVHRDVKPENVLLGQGGTVKVADFGLVRAIATASTTSDSTILGTVAYLSPEQVATGAADARSDVYAAGVVCYEMLTGTPPYTGDTPISVAYRHVNDDVPPPSEATPGIPAALDDLVLRATRRDPALRPSDAAAFLEELVRTRNSLGIHRVPVPTPTPAPIQSPASAPIPVPSESAGPHSGPSSGPLTSATPTPASSGPIPVGGRHRADGRAAEPTEKLPEDAAGRTVVAATVATQHIPPAVQDAMLSADRTVPASAGLRPVGVIGPQGTRAISRNEYGPPTGGVGTVDPYAVPAPPVPPAQRRRNAIASSYRSQRHRGRRTMVIWLAVVLVLAAVLGALAWWLGSGRWTAVPRIGGLDPTTAEQTLQNADLSAALTQAHDDTVPAGRVVGTDPGIGSRALRGSTITVIISEGRPIVPDITPGASPAAAEQAVKAAQLTPKLDPNQDAYDDTVPKGTVLRLNPGAGSQVDIGATVVVVLSKGPAPKPVPNEVGQQHDAAFNALTQAGFAPFDEPQVFNAQEPAGTVVGTTPPAGTIVQPGTSNKVGVQVSNAITVPSLTGMNGQDAANQLQTLGLQAQIQAVANDPNGQVFVQSPAPNTLVAPGTTVTLGVFP